MYVHFVAKKLERYIISVEIRLDFSIHTTRHPVPPKSHADLRTVKKQSLSSSIKKCYEKFSKIPSKATLPRSLFQ